MPDGRYENECHTEFDEKCETRYEEKCETKYETVNEQVDPHWHFHYLEKTIIMRITIIHSCKKRIN